MLYFIFLRTLKTTQLTINAADALVFVLKYMHTYTAYVTKNK